MLVGASVLTAGLTTGFAGGFFVAMASPLGVAGLTYGSIALLGISMIFAGVAGMQAQPPKDVQAFHACTSRR